MDPEHISFTPLIPASKFRKHEEEDNSYADLYCHVEKLIRENYKWARLHPNDVNKTPDNHRYIFDGIHKIHPSPSRNYSPRDNLLHTGLIIPVHEFSTPTVMKVAEKLKSAGYTVKYDISEKRFIHHDLTTVYDVNSTDIIVKMYISL